MSATIIDIADAVVAKVNAATFSREFTAERHVLADFDLPELKDLRVVVMPKAVHIAPGSRSERTYDYDIDVGVQQHVENLAEVDGLLALVEEISDRLCARNLEDLDAHVGGDPRTAPSTCLSTWTRTARSPAC